MTAAPVTVIIVNFNGGEMLRRCIRSLACQTVMPERIDLIDNGSSDGSIESLEAELRASAASCASRISIDRVGGNIGFAAANNRGITRCTTPLVALLNADAFAEPEWLERLCDAARQHPDAASFGSRQMLEGEPGMIDGLGDVYHISGLPWRARHRQRLLPADLQPREIFSPCAAAALYRTEAVRVVGAFDEDYFCYSEDVDLGFRLRLAGHASRYVPESVVHHVGSASSGHRHSDMVVYYGHRNLVWTLAKDMPLALLPLALPAHLAMTLVSLVTLARRGQFQVLCRAKRDALRGLPRMLRKRGAAQVSRKVGSALLLRSMAVSWVRS